MNDETIGDQLGRFWQHISVRRRRQFAFLLILMILASLAEIISIGAVLPFLAVLTAPERVYAHQQMQPLISFLDIGASEDLLLPLTIAFGATALIAGAMRVLLAWVSARLAYATGADLSVDIYRRTLYQPYTVHLARNSSEVVTGVITKVSGAIHQIITPVLMLITSAIMLVAITSILISIEPKVTLTAFTIFACIYLIIIRMTKTLKARNGESVARESTQVVKSLQEGLGGIRDVLIDGSQETHCRNYRSADIPLRRAQGNLLFVGQSPRYVIEGFAMTLIAALAYVLAKQPVGIEATIPVMGALAIGAQRLLPLMQNAYMAWSSIQGGQASFRDTLALLDQPLPDYANQPAPNPLPFRENISLIDVSFRYGPEAPWVLRNLELEIPKGSRIGFIGTTGSGKSTLLDIVMGLLDPTEGALKIDGHTITDKNRRSWQVHIAHVPQMIFLADTSIEENIALGIPKQEIDTVRVKMAAEKAHIAGVIEEWPDGYRTIVGERGIRLSGGQRQRIGIARALYKQADVIVFDEATSALDNETEEAVMQAIEELSTDLTVLLIAHRLTTLKNCTKIVELANGKVGRTGSYKEIVSNPVRLPENLGSHSC